jgi:glutamate--cysteine ligase
MVNNLTPAQRLQAIAPERLRAMRRGIEKESLRSLPDGALALTPHPKGLGSALTHPFVTTDFSESQVELITAAHDSVQACLDELTQIHQAVYREMGDEMLWVSSMPCGLPGDETIPLARYGTSNVGRAKSVYRMGLGHRYGRRMQTISGIHYNWSLPGLGNQEYFALIRNFRRYAFVLLTLFGAAPAVCASFLVGREHDLEVLRGGTLHRPYATSLRMGRLGYQSDAQAGLCVSYNNLEDYAAALKSAMITPHAPYAAIGVKNPGGEYNQLSTALLQIENEFYGLIRPKRTTRSGERPVPALLERGVEYVEVRCLDLNPFEPVGINAQTMRVIDIFLLYCLTSDSPPDSPDEIRAMARNLDKVTARGREPGLLLERGSEPVAALEWANALLTQMAPIALALDAAHGGQLYQQSLEVALALLAQPAQLPSAKVLEQLNATSSGSYVGFVREQSQATKAALLALPWSPEQAARFAQLAADSEAQQSTLQRGDTLSFDAYLAKMLALT